MVYFCKMENLLSYLNIWFLVFQIEIMVNCPLTKRQRQLYAAIKQKISIEDLLQSTTSASSQAQSTTSSLMNLVMQFRKVMSSSLFGGGV